MLEVAGLSWALILTYPTIVTQPVVIYVESEAVCLKDSAHIVNNVKNITATCIPVRADVPVKK